ncbi:MAG: hypothetical protein GTO02_10520 [Candidatus Dadabacteria bacterium]|nr:hypothetical protein [Candidatus Dadabacteria bacterium]
MPTLTDVLPLNATPHQKIEYYKKQIKELQQQKKCYDGMIKERQKIIKKIRSEILMGD